MQKVLLITYYWPPSGGAGVQRWLKLTKYLGMHGVKPYVLTVDEAHASYMQEDHSLLQDVGEDVKVYKTKSFEPINYYAKLVGKDKVPTAGFSNVDNTKWSQKMVNAIRSNLFVPDPRRGWNHYAYKKAVEIITKEQIEVVITTSPPHSTQLLGLKLQKKLNIKWIADLRDPWTDIYYYELLGHSFFSKKLDAYWEKQVVKHADKIITVSQSLKNIFFTKDNSIDEAKIYIVPNGFDPEDFEGSEKKPHHGFVIGYTGTMSDKYNPLPFFDSLQTIVKQFDNIDIKLQIVGRISKAIQQYISNLDVEFELINTVPHSQIVQYQKDADLLLLVIPDIPSADSILTGKLFEYIATGNKIIGIGPAQSEVADILEKCELGQMFDRNNREGMATYIENIIHAYLQNKKNKANRVEIEKYSRAYQAQHIRDIICELLNT
ncbi:MAG: hypothetical protein CSA36_02875 [Draconibacterium sp.]|nr:MAG: hypothetical protein CSA36_02875 [Draconibacterium sp.]